MLDQTAADVSDKTREELSQEHHHAEMERTTKQFSLVHVTLVGLTGIIILLYMGMVLPLIGFKPINSSLVMGVIGLVSVAGIVVCYLLNFDVYRDVTKQARLTEVLVNSLGQGFLSFDQRGLCGSVYSQACLDLLEIIPVGKHIDEVLRVPTEQKEDFYSWIQVLFDPTHALGFDDAVKFLPDNIAHTANRKIKLHYKPVRDNDGQLTLVVVIATDRSEEAAAQDMARQQQEFAEMICKIFQERNQFTMTLEMVQDFIADARKPNVSLQDAAPLLRMLHTLKSGLRHFSLRSFADIVHVIEDELSDPVITSDALFQDKLLYAAERVERELNEVMALVNKIMGNTDTQRGNVYQIGEEKIYDFAVKLKARSPDPALTKMFLEQIAAVPIRECFRSFERELQELAPQLEKQIRPVLFSGSNPRVLTRPLNNLIFSLTHLGRNIVDHGIESPVTRMARGKEAAGSVTVHTDVVREGTRDWLVIGITDDGAGIDPSRVRQKLATMDAEGAWRFEDDQTVIQRIFNWGVSTKTTVSSLSGRGVGLEAVEREVSLLGGSIRVSSDIYQGTKFMIKIPYSIDISDI